MWLGKERQQLGGRGGVGSDGEELCFLPEMQTRPRQGERSAGGPLSEGLWANHSILGWPLDITFPSTPLWFSRALRCLQPRA